MSTQNKQRQAYIGLVMITIIIGLSFIFVKIALKYASAMDLLAHRFTAAAISIILLWIFGFIKLPSFSFKKAKSLLLLSLFYPLLFFALQTFGLQYSSASEAGIVFATTPIITLIAASFFLKEKTTLLQKIGIVMSIAGILYIIFYAGGVSGSTNLKGVILLLLSVFVLVVYYVLGKQTSAKFSAIEITVWMTLLAFIVFNGFSVATHIQSDTLNQFFNSLVHREFLWAVLYLGVLSSMFTAFLTNFALAQVPASQIAVFNNLSPLVSIAGGILILGETLFTYHIIGGVLVLSGVAMTVFFKHKKR
ncbi:MAG TPA: DMT family transporter [Dysgonamonadaceae bacterium]|nr:DMT family transporter [Dysgonamonadaceae bacterium]